MKVETDIWEVSTHDGVYQTDLQTLKQWVAEGLVLPTDRVRKGAFNWIDAGRAPSLRRVFSGEEAVEVPAAPATHAEGGVRDECASSTHETSRDLGLAGDDAREPGASEPHAAGGWEGARAAWGEPAHDAAPQDPGALPHFGAPSLGSSCHEHPAQAASLVCRACGATFCRTCPKRVGSSGVMLCTLCGGFCDPLADLAERAALYERQAEGFGLGDLKQALAYPFLHTASLLGGALLYGFLLLAGWRGQLLAAALVFGCISLVVRRVAYGNLKRDFMPDFSEFSFWDDVVVPCALGVGVTLVTIGPTLLLLLALLFGWLGGAQPQTALRYEDPALAAAEGRPLKGTSEAEEALTSEDMSMLVNGGSAEQEAELKQKLDAMRPGARVGRGLEEAKQDDGTALTVARQLLARPGLILLLALLTLGWAVFYHPMALLVAGWTESLKSVLNPLVGIDTIRHMGGNYFKAFLMYLAVQVAALVLNVLVGLLTAPFNMPFVGNLPGTFLGGVVTFYTSLVIACVLGLALFKSADRFGLELD